MGPHSLSKYWSHKKGKVENILKGSLDLNPITFNYSENSNYGQESLLEV